MNYLLYQLTRSVATFFRTLRAFFTRKIVGIGARLRRLTNFSRHATKAASASLQGVVSAAQKPTGPEDYVETGRLYIAKSLIIRVILGLFAVGLIVYFLVWPFVLSRFLTARFYVQDKRVEHWDGRVIVYSDQKKKVPLYAGRLADGILQGEGKQYDDGGLLLYQGQFVDGVRSGNGAEYSGGVLVYEGQFLDGRWDGRGKSYADGRLAYEGQYEAGKRSGSGIAYDAGGAPLYEGYFRDDLYDGRGKLYQNGRLSYEGGFREGQPDGEGTSYYPSGQASYQGQFAAGVPQGAGTAWDASGRKVYAGAFAEGDYSGDGTLFFADGGELAATFHEGAPEGSVLWKKSGLPYYQGEWRDDAPEGFGTLFSKAGKRIYEGPFLGGMPDGAALLAYSVDELTAALGEGAVRREETKEDFRVVAPELGLTALCTFRTEDRDPAIYKIYLTQPPNQEWVRCLSGMAHTADVQWPEGKAPVGNKTFYHEQTGVPLPGGSYICLDAAENDRRTTVLYDIAGKEALLIAWSRTDLTPRAQSFTVTGDADSRMEGFLDALDLMEGTGGAAVSGSASGGASAEGAFSGCTDAAQAVALTDAMLDRWEQAERLAAVEENLARTAVLLESARAALATDVGTQETVDVLEARMMSLNAQAEGCRTSIKRAELTAEEMGVKDMASYDLSGMLINFDPSQQKLEDLSLIAVAYAQAAGEDVDTAETERRVKTGLLDLVDAYGAVKVALTRYQAAVKDAQTAAGAYATGAGTKEAWYETMNAQADSRADLSTALADFTRGANGFNRLTGGWVSRTFGWHDDVFGPLFQAAVPAGEAPAEEAPAEEAAPAA